MKGKERLEYGNWMPLGLTIGVLVGTGLSIGWLTWAIFGLDGTVGMVMRILALLAVLAALAFSILSIRWRRAFSYTGKRQLSRQIIQGIAGYVRLPDGGKGLDVGCGSGALTIAVAKANPQGEMLGVDLWSGGYTCFTQAQCVVNARHEGVENTRFQKGSAVNLDFPDETFDAVTSNYVYHNIAGKDKQMLLRETLRVLKKGGTFAIHDLMSPRRYGDMEKFVRQLRQEGYADVHLIDTTRGMFMTHREASMLKLTGSTLLVGKK
jgi:SAM-dependent methyltransferase